MTTLPHPYCTRQEAAAYLRISVDTLDKHLVPQAGGRVTGKMRYALAAIGGSRKVRVWTADVIAICPPPVEEESTREEAA